jgi:hypothetical protein
MGGAHRKLSLLIIWNQARTVNAILAVLYTVVMQVP